MEELEAGEVEYEMAEEFLASLKKKFGGGEGGRISESSGIKKVRAERKNDGGVCTGVQEGGRESGYEGRPLVEEFKRGMNGSIRRKLIEAENQPSSIEQWYRRATALNRNWRESRREEKRLREQKKHVGGAPKQEQKQIVP